MCFSSDEYKFHKLIRLCYEGEAAPTLSNLSKLQAYVAANHRRVPRISDEILQRFQDSMASKKTNEAIISTAILDHLLTNCEGIAHLLGPSIVRMCQICAFQHEERLVSSYVRLLFHWCKVSESTNLSNQVLDLVNILSNLCFFQSSVHTEMTRLRINGVKGLYSIIHIKANLIDKLSLILSPLIFAICYSIAVDSDSGDFEVDGVRYLPNDLAIQSLGLIASRILMTDVDKFAASVFQCFDSENAWSKDNEIQLITTTISKGLSMQSRPILLESYRHILSVDGISTSRKISVMKSVFTCIKSIDGHLGPACSNSVKWLVALVETEDETGDKSEEHRLAFEITSNSLYALCKSIKDTSEGCISLEFLLKKYSESRKSKLRNTPFTKVILASASILADVTKNVHFQNQIPKDCFSGILDAIDSKDRDLCIMGLNVIESIFLPFSSHSSDSSTDSSRYTYPNDILWQIVSVLYRVSLHPANLPKHIEMVHRCLIRMIYFFKSRGLLYILPMIFRIQGDIVNSRNLCISHINALHIMTTLVLNTISVAHSLPSLEHYTSSIIKSWPLLDTLCPQFDFNMSYMKALAQKTFSFENDAQVQIQTLFVQKKVVKKILIEKPKFRDEFPDSAKILMKSFNPDTFIDHGQRQSEYQFELDVNSLMVASPQSVSIASSSQTSKRNSNADPTGTPTIDYDTELQSPTSAFSLGPKNQDGYEKDGRRMDEHREPVPRFVENTSFPDILSHVNDVDTADMLARLVARSLPAKPLTTTWVRTRSGASDAQPSPKTAAMLLIGDELLSGKVHDTNGYFLARLLYQQGVDLKKVLVVPDTIPDISKSIVELSGNHDYVFTSGGIGPTHDDMTYDGIAHAFQTHLALDEETKGKMEAKMKPPLNEARLRMALFPQPCTKLWTPDLWVPIVVVRNVYILPGIPRLFERMMEANRHHFVGQPKTLSLVYTSKEEGDLARELDEAQKANEGVSIGSYPQMSDAFKYVKVTIEGRRKELVQSVAQTLLEKLNGAHDLETLLSKR